jgi:hypothetical protein
MKMKSDTLNIFFSVLVTLALLLYSSCKKTGGPDFNPTDTTDTSTDSIKKPIDPPVANTIGFFLNGWQPKTYIVPPYIQSDAIITTNNTVTVDVAEVITKIPISIFGHNANNWMTKMYNEPVFLNHLIKLKPNVIRFPGGSLSNAFFWNCDLNQPPADAPSRLKRADGLYQYSDLYTYGKSANTWQATVDNYYSVLETSNSEGIITINYAYARYGTGPNPVASAAHLAADWVRYDNGRTKYWEVGNENYGSWEWGYRIDVAANKDGQPEYITGKLYAQHFKVFADSMRKAAAEIGKTIYIGAVLYETPVESWMTHTTQTWNSGLIPEINDIPDFYIGHNYFTLYGQYSNATTILDSACTVPGHTMSFMKSDIEKKGGTVKPIALSEWNMWAQDSMQQVSNISGIFAVLVQAEALKNKFGLAARWDLYNAWNRGNDHGLFSAGDEPGVAKWSPRPSFYYMYFFQKCIGDRLVNSAVTGDIKIKSYASTYNSGQASVVLLNTSSKMQSVEVKFKNFVMGKRFYWYVLEGSTDNGEFSRKVIVNSFGPDGLVGGPADYASIKAKTASTSGGIKVMVPGWGAVFIMVDKK